MRKANLYGMSESEALRLLARAPTHHLATTGDGGAPILRVVHGVWIDGALAFHGAPAGEKMEGLGRPAVVEAAEVVAEIPSYFVDAERACPATTYYRSVQAHGVIERVDDPDEKAAVMAALMAKLQPEGGHAPLDPGHAAYERLYRKSVDGLLVARVRPTQIDGKAKLGQNRRPDELARVLEALWRRGRPGDPAAIEAVRAVNPDVPLPEFLRAPPGVTLCCAPGPDEEAETLALLGATYWWEGLPREKLVAAVRGATARVAARLDGRLVGTASALADGGRRAWLMDVAVHPECRNRGVGQALVRLLLDHPAVRGCDRVGLATHHAQSLYRRFGFRVLDGKSEMMWLERGA
jgi:ribosomal protein S18 acetylase RimI-like enzyme/nitroimidazol reductase NimA-like FMN-containing flavoprotein (pyridoxamine 5'-phosphate oxidase superfamily)